MKKLGTEKDILELFPHKTSEDLFWLRVDYGQEHAQRTYHEDVAAKLIKSAHYWAWFIKIWESGEKEFIERARMHKYMTNQDAPFERYELHMLQALHNRRLTRAFYNKIQKETELDDAVPVLA